MSYKLNVPEKDVLGKNKYVSKAGETECAEFVRQAASAPHTIGWRQGVKVANAKSGTIARGTAIATFDAKGRYPVDSRGKHAAIYLSHDAFKITVFDQWNDQGEVKERPIYFNRPKGTRRSNDADTFYVIE